MEPTPTKKRGCLQIGFLIIAGLFVVMLIALLFTPKRDAESQKAFDLSEAQDVLKKAQDDTLRNCYVQASLLLEKSMKDPDSYEEIEHESYFVTQKTKKSPYVQVTIKYRARNSFGGMVVDQKAFNFARGGFLYETIDL